MARLFSILRRIHIAIYAYFVKYYRTRHFIKVFTDAHRQELSKTPVNMWPVTMARQAQEIAAIKAGKLDQAIVERKSWSWPFLPASVNRLSVPLLKATPYNLRRMSRTPVPRRAINLIKGAVISQNWEVRPMEDVDPTDGEDEQKERIKIARKVFSHPNNEDSFQTFLEQGIEDMCCFGAFPAELGLTVDPKRPLKMWPVNVESIRIFASWQESTPDLPKFAQMTGLKGERGAILFYDDEMLYIKDNPSTDNPFGLGKMEVAFQAVNDFLGVQGMAGRAGADQIHKTFLWWEAPQSEAHVQIVRRYIQNELEGQAKLSLIAGMKKPEIVDVTPVTSADLLLEWQELLIRMIANAFDMSAMALGVEHDVNRAVGEVLSDRDFRSAVVPMAKRLQEALTRKVLHGCLGWYDLEFSFLNLDDPDLETRVDMFSKMYSMNAITPNQICKGLNRKTIDSPLADLTQFECMLLNIEAMARVQDWSQEQSMKRQLSMQPPPPDYPPPGLPPGGGGSQGPPGGNGGPGGLKKPNSGAPGQQQQGLQKVTPGSMARGGQPPAPKALALPKFPIQGSRYNARQIAQMPVNQITDVWKATGMRPSQFLKAMDSQEPGILTQLTDEVKVFFQDALDKEQKERKKPLGDKQLQQWKKELAIRVKKQRSRTSDMAKYIQERGKAGDPRIGSSKNSKAGEPGNINPVRRG